MELAAIWPGVWTRSSVAAAAVRYQLRNLVSACWPDTRVRGRSDSPSNPAGMVEPASPLSCRDSTHKESTLFRYLFIPISAARVRTPAAAAVALVSLLAMVSSPEARADVIAIRGTLTQV